MHPVGPEGERTYWIRRGVAVLVLVVLVTGTGFMISALGGGGADIAATPAAQPSQAESVGEPGEPAEPVEDLADQSEAVPREADSAPEAPAQTEEPLPPEPANTFHRSPEPVAAAAKPTTAFCDPKSVTVALGGPAEVRADVPLMFRVTATNNSERDCLLAIDGSTFELKIFSGSDRIWTSKDCVSGMPPRGAVLAPGRAMEWEMEWRANRSTPECQTRPGKLNPGTYVATAQLREADPTQLVMQLRA